MSLSPNTLRSLSEITGQYAARERQGGDRRAAAAEAPPREYRRARAQPAAAPCAPPSAVQHRAAAPPSLVLKYGQRVVLRSSSEGYLAVHAVGRRSTRRAAAARAAFARFHRRGNEAGKVAQPVGVGETLSGYVGVHQLSVGVSGTGVGGEGEAFEVINAYRLDDRGPVRFGDTVALRSCLGHARGKLLAAAAKASSRGMSRAVSALPMGVAEEADVKLTRDQIGKAERWEIQRAEADGAGEEAVGGGARSEDLMSRLDRHAQRIRSEKEGGAKTTVRHCDRITLRASSGHVLQVAPAAAAGGAPRVCLRAMPSGGARSSSSATESSAGALWRRNVAEWSVAFAHAPWTPEWSRIRPFLVGTALLGARAPRPSVAAGEGAAAAAAAAKRDDDDVHIVEQALVDDLLSAFTGNEGEYICSSGGDGGGTGGRGGDGDGGALFTVCDDARVDRASLALVMKCLPLAEDASYLAKWVALRQRHEFGLVAHALSAELKTVLKDFALLVAQLETQQRTPSRSGGLTLQLLWFLVQPSLQTLALLRRVCEAAAEQTGGALLTVLHRQATMVGDSKSRLLLLSLLEKASVPFFEMLARWIFAGGIVDRYSEFMVEEHSNPGATHGGLATAADFNAEYWDRRYTPRSAMVPDFIRMSTGMEQVRVYYMI